MSLAIVIPAYKKQFLGDALLSVSKQSDNDFTVYIGDDASPENLFETVNGFTNKLNIVYKKFENNLGSINLTLQWERCINLVKDKEWIWLFSDDDLMDIDCVKNFKKTLLSTKSGFDLYRFNTKVIDTQGNIIQENPPHPPIESSIKLALARLEGKRGLYAIEYIFSKQRYLKADKFVSFPVAWSSDEATWIKFGAEKGIFTIDNVFVYWRHGITNISTSASFDNEKINATVLYLKWLKNWLTGCYEVTNEDISRYEVAKIGWLKHQLTILNKPFKLIEIIRLTRVFNQSLSIPVMQSLSLFIGFVLRPLRSKAGIIKRAFTSKLNG